MNSLISVKNLWVESARQNTPSEMVVKGLSFDLAPREVLGVIGESGAGKSTLALAALGYVRPGCRLVSGEVWSDGTDVMALDSDGRRAFRARNVGYIAQSPAAAFNGALKLGTQLTEAAVVHGLRSPEESRKHAIDLCAQLGLPEPAGMLDRYPHQVSGGQLQRLLIAMACACDPKLLVLDEPTTAIDATTQIEVLRLLKNVIVEHHTAGIYVTHDLAVVSQIADRIMVLNKGELIEAGTTEQIIHAPRESYTKALLRSSQRGQKAPAAPGFSAPEPATPQLSVKNVDVGYGRASGGGTLVTVLHDISFDVPRGSFLGVIGESGSGKSTLARAISGLSPRQSGEIRIGGEVLPPRVEERSREMLRRIQLVTQMPDVAFNPSMRVGDILSRPLEFYFRMPAARRRERVAELLNLVSLPADYARRLPRHLSGGEKQRINLARALAADPEVLLCDEVTSALDAIVTENVINLIVELQRRLNLTVVFISHDIPLMRSCADRVLVLNKGYLVEQGPAEGVLTAPSDPYSLKLIRSVPELRRGWLEEVADPSGLEHASRPAPAGSSPPP
ncbi:MAG: ABC transporter ATP-binding protein [Pseudorhodoplanes sp.]